MKISHLIFAGFFSLMVFQSCNSKCDGKKCEGKEHGEEMMENKDVQTDAETTLRIEGMMCEVGCKGTIEKTLMKTTGVGSAVINFDESKAVVKYDSKQIDEAGIIEVINNINDHTYTATPWTDEAPVPTEMQGDSVTADEVAV